MDRQWRSQKVVTGFACREHEPLWESGTVPSRRVQGQGFSCDQQISRFSDRGCVRTVYGFATAERGQGHLLTVCD
jgi:hypothetical protein